jgi:ABC-type sugar transport system permease subunit
VGEPARRLVFRSGGEFVGLDNYGELNRVFTGPGTALAIGLGLAAGAIAVVVGGGLALLAYRAGRAGRRIVWIGFALPLASLASTAIIAAWHPV